MELLSVYESLLLLHNNNYRPNNNQNGIILPDAVSFQGKLNLSKVVFLGHSFGGATALTAAAYRPDITLAVVAHEPATDWMPDFGRKALFMDERRRKGSNIPYSGGTGGFVTTTITTGDDDASNNNNNNNSINNKELHYTHEQAFLSIHCNQTRNYNNNSKDDTNYSQSNLQDSVHMLVLYSEEWAKLGWGGFPLLKCMYDRDQFGPKHNRHVVSSSVQVIHRTKHMGFSDWCALTPLWLGRLMGSSSSDGMNPLQSLDIIMNHTMEFLHKAIKAN
jgi:pimeloyl-ACP methyl ester carboxylesterase